jgi:hypothetical protein
MTFDCDKNLHKKSPPNLGGSVKSDILPPKHLKPADNDEYKYDNNKVELGGEICLTHDDYV